MSKGSATLRCFALALRSRATRSPVMLHAEMNAYKPSATSLLMSLRWIGGRWLQLAMIALFVIIFLGAGDDMEARFNTLGHKKLICVCGCNQILLECNHVGCTYSDGMRNELASAIRRGDSNDLVLQAFVQKYGSIVLAAPTTTGFNLMAWITPYVLLLAGFAFAGMIVRSWKNRPLSQPEPLLKRPRGAEDRGPSGRRAASLAPKIARLGSPSARVPSPALGRSPNN